MKLESMDADELFQVLEEHELHTQIPDEALESFVFFGLSLYGSSNQENLIPHLISLYRELSSRSEVEVRMRLNSSITKEVGENTLSVNALLPFIGFEQELSIVSTAVLDYCMYRETEEDELAGVKDVIGILRSGICLCPGGVVGGLVLLGDKRVVDLLYELPYELPYLEDNSDIAAFARTFSGFLYQPMIDFYLTWLEVLNSTVTELEFGSLASGLVNMVQKDNFGVVTSVERRYGKRDAELPIVNVSQIPFGEYLSEIEGRLLNIAEAETAPKIMPTVIGHWRMHRDHLEGDS